MSEHGHKESSTYIRKWNHHLHAYNHTSQIHLRSNPFMFHTSGHQEALLPNLASSPHNWYCEHEIQQTAHYQACIRNGMWRLHECAWWMRKTFIQPNCHIIFTIFQSSNISIFLLWHQNTTISLQLLHVSLLMDERFQIYWNVTTNSSNVYRNHAIVWLKWHLHEEGIMDSAASGSWGNYWEVCEHMHIMPLFLKRLKKMINFLLNIC